MIKKCSKNLRVQNQHRLLHLSVGLSFKAMTQFGIKHDSSLDKHLKLLQTVMQTLALKMSCFNKV